MDMHREDEGKQTQEQGEQTRRDNNNRRRNDVAGFLREELIGGDPVVILQRIAQRSKMGWSMISEMFLEKLEECGDDFIALKRFAGILGINRAEWFCPACNNKNYWFRKYCNLNKCKAMRPREEFTSMRDPPLGMHEPSFDRGRRSIEPQRWNGHSPRGMVDEPWSRNARKRPFPNDGYGGGYGYNKRFREERWVGGREHYVPGSDWTCPICHNLNYASRQVCNAHKCNEQRPDLKPRGDRRGVGGREMTGDWRCPQCHQVNYALKKICGGINCNLPNPNMVTKGDWVCPKCTNINYGNRAVCTAENCNEARPPPQNGDWICAECNNLNYNSREVCNMRSCRAPRPEVKHDQD